MMEDEASEEPMIMTILGPVEAAGNDELLGCSLANEVSVAAVHSRNQLFMMYIAGEREM